MIRLLRRSRLLALALLLATPALGGAWLQAAHPCPVETPWLGGAEGGHEGHGEQEHTAGGCHCFGSCTGAAVAVLPAASILAIRAEPVPAVRPSFAPAAPAPALRPSDRLPPATAPPLV